MTTTNDDDLAGKVRADAIRALTAAARPPADFADMLAHILAAVAANVGGVDRLLAGRPGSWEADLIRQLLAGTVGWDEEHLLENRTDPIVVHIDIDAVLADAGVLAAYDNAHRKVMARYDHAGLTAIWPAPPPTLTIQQEQVADRLADLEERLDQQFDADRLEYAAALTANVEAAARDRPDILVPVIVSLTSDGDGDSGLWDGVGMQLVQAAVAATPLPGVGRRPLDWLNDPAD